ncbi:toxin-activating lysine-acyltransferase [Yoonia vestfoldensis]|uniref:toxin-activating lysine-acyltransferase n=1 Tax=Yoonia vestfoldensis TaxID=245188 RepID=UPI0003776DBC|nr:toxin-activating lysine-acyltransferase [Yoonia vestfoldensis]
MTPEQQAARDREMPSQEKLRVYGDCLFLAMRSQHHAGMTLATLRAAFEPAIDAGQFRIFRIDDIPRGMFTWAFLSPDAEARFVAGAPLTAQDWTSGDRLWLIDLIAPYKGMTAAMVRWIMRPGNFAEKTFIFRRVMNGNKTRKILHVDFDRPDAKVTFLHPEDFV